MSSKKNDQHQIINEIVNSVRLLQSISRQQSSDFIRKHRITGPQLGALRFISMIPNISMRELSDCLYLHISTVSGIVDRLVKRGYVKRERSEEDRRVVNLKVTTEGKRVIETTPLAGMGLLFHTIDRLSDKQLKDIQKGLRLILNVMKLQVNSSINDKDKSTKEK